MKNSILLLTLTALVTTFTGHASQEHKTTSEAKLAVDLQQRIEKSTIHRGNQQQCTALARSIVNPTQTELPIQGNAQKQQVIVWAAASNDAYGASSPDDAIGCSVTPGRRKVEGNALHILPFMLLIATHAQDKEPTGAQLDMLLKNMIAKLPALLQHADTMPAQGSLTFIHSNDTTTEQLPHWSELLVGLLRNKKFPYMARSFLDYQDDQLIQERGQEICDVVRAHSGPRTSDIVKVFQDFNPNFPKVQAQLIAEYATAPITDQAVIARFEKLKAELLKPVQAQSVQAVISIEAYGKLSIEQRAAYLEQLTHEQRDTWRTMMKAFLAKHSKS